MSFGFQNELDAHTQEQLAKDASHADALVGLVVLFIAVAYALASYLDQPGVTQ
jgi:hypothetical protein